MEHASSATVDIGHVAWAEPLDWQPMLCYLDNSSGNAVSSDNAGVQQLCNQSA